MRHLKYALALAAIAAAATSANAATKGISVDVADGTGTFWDKGISTPTFDDTFTFSLPSPFSGGSSVTSTAVSVTIKGKTTVSKDITFTSATLNGVSFTGTFSGLVKSLSWAGDLNYGSTLNVIHLTGNVAGGPASYTGDIEFVPMAAVPETATWAMMIGGLGFAGAALRRRKAGAQNVQAALA